ncbi:golgin candidate 5 [Beta vulgaris subsp. vulgaris]|uniref:golgin candidate 5 n=1 Tax=Beta vulgaris subsp. vulgaris TaxID=3555 RepID=UPI0020373D4D|nr:golgin candidate 5 [Beta vulgaris subsp. vulgaris]
MDWWGGKVSLGNLDFSGAVNKLQESVKSIEKNFDSALGLEDKLQSSDEASGPPTSSSSRNALFDPVMAFMGNKEEDNVDESKEREIPQDEARIAENKDDSSEHLESMQGQSVVEEKKVDGVDTVVQHVIEPVLSPQEEEGGVKEQMDYVASEAVDEVDTMTEYSSEVRSDAQESTASPEVTIQDAQETSKQLDGEEKPEEGSLEHSESAESKVVDDQANQHHTDNFITREASDAVEPLESMQELAVGGGTPKQEEVSSDSQAGNLVEHSENVVGIADAEIESSTGSVNINNSSSPEFLTNAIQGIVSGQAIEEASSTIVTIQEAKPPKKDEVETKDDRPSPVTNVFDSTDSVYELEKVKREMKMMETALQGAAKQAQAKADEIAKLMNENEQLKSVVENLSRKSNGEIESLREEYHQRVATLERKVYALTKERDTLRREQNKRSDAAALLKEKDEIINQVMAEGEELSKKQAAQEAQMRKLRAQIRELDEEKKALATKLQLEENKVESIRKDKAATEKLLQETIEKHQAELAGQKEYYTNALNAAKEAEALAEARANDEARNELEGRLREAEERDTMLVQTLEELRQTLSSQEQQAIMKEDMLRREIEDLQKRYQESERRCEELVSQLPESTRPLLRQIEAMQETSARKAEAWVAVERTLQSRLQEAEAKAASAEERERSMNDRLSQTLSRINVLEAQISCLRAEQTQLNRSLEKERQRAAENRQEYLAAKEIADTHEGRANQLDEEIKGLKRKHKNELQESLAHRELLQQELDREKAARLDLEKAAHVQSSLADQSPTTKKSSTHENGMLTRKLSSASSVGNIEESFFLQASLDSSSSLLERRNSGEATMSPYYLKSMTPSAFEASLRQKEGELASYMSRLASMEAIRDSLAEELVKMTEQCEKLRSEATMLPGIRAELEALRRRHTAALELMGERDEELEELRADIVDLKEMYREQVNLLVNKIQTLSSQMGAT